MRQINPKKQQPDQEKALHHELMDLLPTYFEERVSGSCVEFRMLMEHLKLQGEEAESLKSVLLRMQQPRLVKLLRPSENVSVIIDYLAKPTALGHPTGPAPSLPTADKCPSPPNALTWEPDLIVISLPDFVPLANAALDIFSCIAQVPIICAPIIFRKHLETFPRMTPLENRLIFQLWESHKPRNNGKLLTAEFASFYLSLLSETRWADEVLTLIGGGLKERREKLEKIKMIQRDVETRQKMAVEGGGKVPSIDPKLFETAITQQKCFISWLVRDQDQLKEALGSLVSPGDKTNNEKGKLKLNDIYEAMQALPKGVFSREGHTCHSQTAEGGREAERGGTPDYIPASQLSPENRAHMGVFMKRFGI